MANTWITFGLQVFSVLSILLLFFTLKNFLPGYFNEKGKNLATKEDIGDITKSIEGIKNEFTKETETLKAGLQRLTAIETSHRNEERTILIEFYTKANQWVYACMETTLSNYNVNNIPLLIEKREYIEKYYAETSVAQSKIKLLVQNDELIFASGEFYQAILHFKSWLQLYLFDTQQKLQAMARIKEQYLPISKFMQLDSFFQEEIAKEDLECSLEYKNLQDQFNKIKLEEFTRTITPDLRFSKMVREYITK